MEPHIDLDLNDDQLAPELVVGEGAEGPAESPTSRPQSSSGELRIGDSGSSAVTGLPMSRETWYTKMALDIGGQLATCLGWPQDRGRNISLYWASLNLWMKGDFGRLVPSGRSAAVRMSRLELRKLVREYGRNTADPLPISKEYYRKAYDRLRYRRELEAERSGTEQEWNEGLRELVLEERDAIYARIHAAHPTEHILRDPHEVIVEELDMRLLLEKLTHYLPPAEAEGLRSLLSEEPTKDAADRRRRSRARKAVKNLLLPFLEGELMNEPTLAETVNVDHEQRLRDLERHVGMPEGGRRAIAAAVEEFLDSLEVPSSK